MKKTLQTLYLRFDSSSKSLTKLALSQLLLKIAFSFSTPPSKDLILTELTGLLGTTLSDSKVDEAFDLLLTEKKLTYSQDKILISEYYRKKIQTAFDEFIARQDRIIDKYFASTESDIGFIKKWFEDVTIEFFKEYSTEWVADLCVTENAVDGKHHGILSIIEKVSSRFNEIKLKDRQYLKKQYLKFIQGSDKDTYSILWDYGTSCFSSTLVVANTSVDPITIDEFKNSKCILDTNILMYLDLERSKYNESFESMEKIFASLNIQPVYLLITREEFVKSMAYKRETTLKVLDNYSLSVVEETNDPFIATALHRGCVTSDDFVQFFDQLIDIPAFVSNTLSIKAEDSLELESAIKAGQADEALKDRLNNIYKNKRNRNKRKSPLTHDAGLISGAAYIRKTEKCFILSRDISVNEYALENPIRQDMPIAIGLDTLINVLAIDNGGTDIDPTNYAPLFANIIKLALIPDQDVFKVEDLSRMLDIQAQISDLPDEKITDIAKELHHNKVKNVPEDEISLQLNRRFQSAKLELQSNLDKAQKETLIERREKEKHLQKSERVTNKLREKLTAELRDKYDSHLRRNRVLIFLILPVLTIVLSGLILFFKDEIDQFRIKEQTIGVSLNIIAWLLTDFLFLNKKIKSRYSERILGISEEVEKKIKETIGE